MGSALTRASGELFRRTPDETFETFEALREHCRGTREASRDHWVPADRLVDKWKDTTSFGRDDLPLVGKVADKAHSWIFEQGASGGGESE